MRVYIEKEVVNAQRYARLGRWAKALGKSIRQFYTLSYMLISPKLT